MDRIFVLLLSIVFLLPHETHSSQSSTCENAVQAALILFRNGEYENAKEHLLPCAETKQDHPHRSTALLVLTKTLLELKDIDNALQYADRLLDEYPTSRYRAFAHFYKALALYAKNNFSAAFLETAKAIEYADLPETQYRFETAATDLIRIIGASEQIDAICRSPEWAKARPILLILSAQAHSQLGEAKRALQMIDQLLAEKPEPRYRTIAVKLKEKLEMPSERAFRIGLFMPLTGYFGEEAQEFLAGLALALKLRKENSPPVELLSADTEGSVSETQRKARDLLNAGVDAVIGELEVDQSAAIADLTAEFKTPLLIPTATEKILTAQHDNVFQLNSPIEIRSRALADYAVRRLGARVFAMLTPADEIGNRWAEAFASEVARLGGILICRKTYEPDSTNFSIQFEEIREAGFRYSAQQTLSAGGRVVDPAEVERVYSLMNQETRRKFENRENLPKQTRIPLQSVDAVFIPMNEEELPFIASQFALYNIKAQLLAGDQVYNLEKLREQQSYLNNMIFVSGYYFSDIDLGYTEFVEQYRTETGREPGPMAAWGYNTMQLLLEGLDAGNTTAASMHSFLSGVTEFEGVGTFIRLNNPFRVNHFVNILQFVDGNVFRLNTLEQ